ncbi:MAG: hypothetical protein ACJAU6_002667 [Alphaproteobacteria bacterium]
MHQRIFSFLGGLALIFVASSPVLASSRTLLNSAQLEALFGDGLEVEIVRLEATLIFVYEPDGTWTGENDTGRTIWGKWRIENDALCRTVDGRDGRWQKLRALLCMQVGSDGESYYLGHSDHTLDFKYPPMVANGAAPATVTPAAPAIQTGSNSEVERIEQQRAQLAAEAGLEREKLDAERRDLERMRLQFERDKLRQQQALLNQKKPAPKQEFLKKDVAPPTIRAASNLTTRGESIGINAVVKDNMGLVRVEVNGETVSFNARNGIVRAETPVAMGKNEIRISAFDAVGNRRDHIVQVTRTRNIPEVEFGAYHAVVIGINDYTSLPKLKTAIADARAVAKTLKEKYNFTVRLLENPSRGDIIDIFDEMREILEESNNLLIYYAGHGWLDQQSRWLSNSDLTDALQAILAKHVMVVADSCFSGTLTRSIKVPGRNPNFIKRMAEKRARVVLSSGGLEPVSDSGGGDHSIFAAQFLYALNENSAIMDGTQLFETVRHKVVLNAQQTPEYSDIRLSGHEGGDFLFVRRD